MNVNVPEHWQCHFSAGKGTDPSAVVGAEAQCQGTEWGGRGGENWGTVTLCRLLIGNTDRSFVTITENVCGSSKTGIALGDPMISVNTRAYPGKVFSHSPDLIHWNQLGLHLNVLMKTWESSPWSDLLLFKISFHLKRIYSFSPQNGRGNVFNLVLYEAVQVNNRRVYFH